MFKKKILLSLVLLASCFTSGAQKVIFSPQWKPQAQFAGYYVALEKGFFKDEGLDVIIRHVGNSANETAANLLIDGQIQIAGCQLFPSIQKRSAGAPIVNVFQLTQGNALCCVASNPIKSFEDLDGMKIARWSSGYAELCDMLEKSEGIDVEWVPAFNPVNLFIYGAVDGVIVYSYSELIQLQQALGELSPKNVIHLCDEKVLDIPEDGLYVTEEYYSNNRETIEKFVRATRKGWDYTRSHVDEALEITWKCMKDHHVVSNRSLQKAMLEEFLRLQINPRTGKADYEQITPGRFSNLKNIMTGIGVISADVEYKDFIK